MVAVAGDHDIDGIPARGAGGVKLGCDSSTAVEQWQRGTALHSKARQQSEEVTLQKETRGDTFCRSASSSSASAVRVRVQ
jgi:hypothetical protein